MPQIFIPPLGTVLQLEQDWTFRLFDEHRNDPVQKAAKLYPPYRKGLTTYAFRDTSDEWRDMDYGRRAAEVAKSGWLYEKPEGWTLGDYWTGDWSHEFTFREGTELKVDRIYIRQGNAQYSSVSFRSNCWVSSVGDPLFTASRKTKSLRFWAKLDDVNNMVARVLPSSI